MAECIGYISSASIIIIYIYTRHWVISNVIAIGIVMASSKIVCLTSGRVAVIFLFTAFFYDVFWVYLS